MAQAPVRIKYDKAAARKAISNLNQLVEIIVPKNMNDALDLAHDVVVEEWMRNIVTEGGEYGKWEPLSEATERIRAQSGFPPGPIHMRTGRFARAIAKRGKGHGWRKVRNRAGTMYKGIISIFPRAKNSHSIGDRSGGNVNLFEALHQGGGAVQLPSGLETHRPPRKMYDDKNGISEGGLRRVGSIFSKAMKRAVRQAR